MPVERSDLDSWANYQIKVVGELERHEKKIDDILEILSETKTQIALLHLKSGLWGALAGSILPGLYVLYELIKGK